MLLYIIFFLIGRIFLEFNLTKNKSSNKVSKSKN